jgi:hypothetical protein
MSTGQVVPCAIIPIAIRELSWEQIRESSTNPRRAFDEAKLKELAEVPGSMASCNRFLLAPCLSGSKC